MDVLEIEWHCNELDADAPASAEVGEFCLYVSRVSDCVFGRWVWTIDDIEGDIDDPRPALHGIATSRAEAMAAAAAAMQAAAAGTLRLVV